MKEGFTFSISFWLKLHTTAFWSFKEFRASAAINLSVKFCLFPILYPLLFHTLSGRDQPCQNLQGFDLPPHSFYLRRESKLEHGWTSMCFSSADCRAHWDKGKCVCACVRERGLRVWNIVQAYMQITALSYMQWINVAVCQAAASITPRSIFYHLLFSPKPFWAYVHESHLDSEPRGECCVFVTGRKYFKPSLK